MTPPVENRIPSVSITTVPAVELTETLPNSSALMLVMLNERVTETLIVDTADAPSPTAGDSSDVINKLLLINLEAFIVWQNSGCQ